MEVCVECTKKLFGLFDFVSDNEYDPTFIDYVFSKGFVGWTNGAKSNFIFTYIYHYLFNCDFLNEVFKWFFKEYGLL